MYVFLGVGREVTDNVGIVEISIKNNLVLLRKCESLRHLRCRLLTKYKARGLPHQETEVTQHDNIPSVIVKKSCVRLYLVFDGDLEVITCKD